MRIQCRDAIIDDLPFINALFVDCMNSGHFAKLPNQVAHGMLKRIIEEGLMTRQVERQMGDIQIEEVGTWITSVLVDDEFAGFLVSAQESQEHPERIEIYQLAISGKFKHVGIATHLLQVEEKLYDSDTRFFARCYANSTGAISLLQTNGFRIEQILANSGTHYFRKP